MSRIAVFAYASLVAPASAAETLGRPLPAPLLARLAGWRRGWTLARDNRASEKTFALADGSLPSFCLGLNLEPDAEATAPNGALLEVSVAELDRLDRREIRYRRVDVTAQVEAETGSAHGYAAVYAYAARPEHHHPEPPEGAVIIASYPRTVEAAFASHGAEQLDLYRASTAPPPVEVVEATLVRDEIPEGNPRSW